MTAAQVLLPLTGRHFAAVPIGDIGRVGLIPRQVRNSWGVPSLFRGQLSNISFIFLPLSLDN